MLRRVPLRNNRSDKSVKPRVMDAIFADDGTVWLETKDRGNLKQIQLADVLEQIENAKK